MNSLNTPQIEIETIKQAQQGSVKAFNKLFYKYKTFVEHILLEYIKDMDESKDLTNIVFLKIHNKLKQFTDYKNFKGWIYSLTKNTAIDYLRTIKEKTVSIDDTERNIQLSEAEIDKELSYTNQFTYDSIIEMFNNLPEQYSRICKMFYINNLTINQISKKLNVPKGTIKSYLHRSRSIIKNHLNLC